MKMPKMEILELKNEFSEIKKKKSLDGFNSQMDILDERVNELEKTTEITQDYKNQQ